jgi:hypothetical protein
MNEAQGGLNDGAALLLETATTSFDVNSLRAVA